MKRRSLSTTLILVSAGLFLTGFFSSCLKEEFLKNEDGEYVTDSLGHKIPSDSTIIYITQEIPDINKFMPDILLRHMNQMDALHYGTEPPKIDGEFMADYMFVKKTIFMPESNYQNIVEGSPIGSSYGLTFYDQIWSVMKCDYSRLMQPAPNMYFYECSTDDSTYQILHSNFDKFKEYDMTPDYFKDGNFNTDEFKNTYIIGSKPYFTMFFYQVLRNELPVSLPFTPKDFRPVIANIISGKYNESADGLDNITDFYWGRQCIGYIKTGDVLNQAIEEGLQPYYGDAWICNNQGHPLTHPVNEPDDNESNDNE